MANNIIFNLPRRTTCVIINHIQRRNMPVNVPPTATGKRRFRLAVETDPHKLVNYCCGINYHIDEPLVKLKPDNEYPDWLWELRLSPKPNSWELEEGTKEYYLKLAEEGRYRNAKLKEKLPMPSKIVGQVLKTQKEYLHHIRFAALAHLENDAGFEADSMETDWWRNTYRIQARDYYLPKNPNKVIYKDKVEGNLNDKNYYRDSESTFAPPPKSIHRRPSISKKAVLDSVKRHRYTGN